MQKLLYVIAVIVFLGMGGLFWHSHSSAQSDTLQTTVRITVCGNDVQESGEQCDGTDLAGESCTTQGFTGGTLSCDPACDFDTSSCTSTPGGGGGGGGGRVPATVSEPATQINFTGQASPGDTVFLLKDAQLAGTAVVGPDGVFSFSLRELSGGSYIFSLYSQSPSGERSSFVTLPVQITPHTVTNVSGIVFDFEKPIDSAQARCADPNNDSHVDLVDFSILLFWFERSAVPTHIDCNGDGKADLVDFSIMAYYWTG
ncbi:MAG TPA: hypothetical protein VFE94_03430 [Candidatus Paceibacterota bacterium]|nr:hypothetical protein [Candidatus Paceibacterota bacterium]